MEPRQQPNEDSSSSGKGNFLCRQSSTRWTPTTEQIRILKDLYYNSGVRSPSAEQIQKISARLRQYGKIEGKNVFYWFQNYKARERQKKRFISTTDVPMQRAAANGGWRPEDSVNKYQNISSAGVSAQSPSAAMYSVPEMAHYEYGGSVNTEKSFRDCAKSSTGSSGVGGSSISHNFGWVGMDPYLSSCTDFDKKKSILDDTIKEEEEEGEEEEEEEEEETAPNIETLPLFPMHAHAEDEIKPNPNSYYSGGWYGSSSDGNVGSWASLELSLNSYNSRSSGSM